MILSISDFFKYLLELGFIDHSRLKCVKCQGKLNLVKSISKNDQCVYHCENIIFDEFTRKRKLCGSSRSVRANSWFSGSHLSLYDIVMYSYYWWTELSLKFIEREVGIAHQTAVDWASFCREVAIDVVLEHSEQIGGPGVVVEIDESKFGKRKYHRGRLVEGVWVFGGVERDTGKCFLVPVPNRSEKTLIDLIKKWIKPGTIIISDCWKAYANIKEHNDYRHFLVNHSINFVDPESGEHTNTVEGLWHLVKLSLPATHRKKEHFLGYLSAFMLRKKWRNIDGFLAFMQAAAKLYVDGTPEK